MWGKGPVRWHSGWPRLVERRGDNGKNGPSQVYLKAWLVDVDIIGHRTAGISSSRLSGTPDLKMIVINRSELKCIEFRSDWIRLGSFLVHRWQAQISPSSLVECVNKYDKSRLLEGVTSDGKNEMFNHDDCRDDNLSYCFHFLCTFRLARSAVSILLQ